MSRSQSAIRLDQMPPTGSATGASAVSGGSNEPSFFVTSHDGSEAGGPGSGSHYNTGGPGSGGMPTVLEGGGDSLTASMVGGAAMSAEDAALVATWERIRTGTGVTEPMDLIHKALDQLSARTELEGLEAQTRAKLADLSDEGEQLQRRRERSGTAASVAAGKRLERLHDLVSNAEKELARSTAALGLSDAAVASARRGVAELDGLASQMSAAVAASGARGAGYLRLGDPMECESASLPNLMQNAVDAILLAVRAADALAAAKAVVEDTYEQPEPPLPPASPSMLAQSAMA